jgi:hypothetical protein
MALADDIRAVSERSLAALAKGHDYFTYSQRLWALLEKLVGEGRTFQFRNRATRTAVNQSSLLELVPEFVDGYLTAFTFQHFVSLFEDFIFDLLRCWLLAHPGSMSKKTVELGTLLQMGEIGAVVANVVERELNEIKYGRLASWFTSLNSLVKLDCPTPEEIEQLAEIKATRDVLVHNRGIANATYRSKAGALTRAQDGELLELPTSYHIASWAVICKVVRDVSAAAIAKA